MQTTHVHDNDGRRDEHLLPFEGTIDWERDAARPAEGGLTTDTLFSSCSRARRPVPRWRAPRRAPPVRGAARRLGRPFTRSPPSHTMTTYIEDIAQPRRPDRHAAGLAAQSPLERQDPLPHRARRHRLHPGRDVEGRCRRGDVRQGGSSRAGIVHHRHRHRARRQARAGRLRDRRLGLRGRDARARLPDHAEGARRRLSARPPAPVDSRAAPAGDPAHPPRESSMRAATSSTAAASSWRIRRSSRRPRARARRRCSRCSTSRTRPPI